MENKAIATKDHWNREWLMPFTGTYTHQPDKDTTLVVYHHPEISENSWSVNVERKLARGVFIRISDCDVDTSCRCFRDAVCLVDTLLDKLDGLMGD